MDKRLLPLFTIILTAGLVLGVGSTQVAQASTRGHTSDIDTLGASTPITVDDRSVASVDEDIPTDPLEVAIPLAQASAYTYTVTLPDDTFVVMGDHSAVLPFTIANDAASSANIDSVTIGMPPSVYWVSTATNAPDGWQVKEIKNAGSGWARVHFEAITTTNAITPGGQAAFDVIVVGNQFGVIPSAEEDKTDVPDFVTVKSGETIFVRSSPEPSWERKALAISLWASPSSLGVDNLVSLTMNVFNRSTVTQTAVIPTTTLVSGSGSVTPASGPSPAELSIPPGQSDFFTWTYTATTSGDVVFGNSASNDVASSVSAESNTVLIGDFTAALSLEPTQIISGQLATVDMTVKNNAASAITNVTPSALGVLGTATTALASGPSPSSVASLASGATASFQWVYTITGDIGATYRFTGTASAGSGITSNVATSPEGVIKKYTVSVTPRYVPIGTTNQTFEYVVANNGGARVEFVEFTLPSGFTYSAGNASGGYGVDWDVVTDGGGNPKVIQFEALAIPTDTVPVGAMATFSITFDALPTSAADYSFPVRVRDTSSVEESVEAVLSVTEYDIVVEASPSSGIYADGVTSSVITATVTFSGTPQSGKGVLFHATKGVLSSETGTTNASGVTTTTLTAPQSSEDTSALVTASCNGVQDQVVVYYLGSHVLTVNVSGSGAVIKEPNQVAYQHGDVVTLTATPDPGWSFSAWSGDLVTTTNPATITVDGDKTVTATFTQDEYTLTLNTSGEGSAVPDPVQATYHYGDVVTLTATANPEWTFDAWSGDVVDTASQVTTTISGDTVVTATFTQDEYTLTLNTSGSGSAVPDPAQATYHYGDVVTLTATANPGWTFDAWSGDVVDTASQVTTTISGDTTVTATFTQDEYTLAINVLGSGSVTRDPDQPTYLYGDVVTLTATPDPGWSFSAWSGDLVGASSPATITVDGDKTVTATFTQDGPPPPIKITIAPDLATIMVGQSITYTATAEDAQGNTWDVTAETDFTVETGAEDTWIGNVYTSGKVGDWVVTGEYEGLTDTATLTVDLIKVFLPLVVRNY